LYVHRKGATRALPPGHPALPAEFSKVGQPVLVGGSMGTASYILAGVAGSEGKSLSSACHGAGRLMSRGEAKRRFQGREVVGSLKRQGILVRTPSFKGIAEEAPGAYKDVHMVIEVTQHAGLARTVAKVRPVINVKG
jgi:tRNA-splicing ligase RtcB